MEVIMFLFEYFMPILATIVVGMLYAWMRKRWSAEELEIIRKIVRDGVLFAQQMYVHLSGAERFDKAMEAIIIMLDDKGIKVDEQMLRFLIEATVKIFKDTFGDKWYNEPGAVEPDIDAIVTALSERGFIQVDIV